MRPNGAHDNASALGRQLGDAQLRNEQLRKLRIDMLKVDCRQLLIIEVVRSGASVAEGFENPRDRGDPGQRLLRRERAKRDVVVDKSGPSLADHRFIRLYIRNPLAIEVPKRKKQI